MTHLIQFRLKEDFDRFRQAPPQDLSLDYISEGVELAVVMVSGLNDERIPDIEREYNAEVFKDAKLAPSPL
jgi:hypothetical protein